MSALLILLAVAAGLYVVWKLLKRGQMTAREAITVDRKDVLLEFRFGSKLPKALKAAATTVTPVICFRCYPKNYPVQVVGRPPVSVELVAHEFGHVVRRVRLGWLEYWWEIYRDIVVHPFNHAARPSEIQAEADGKAILAGTFLGVDAALALSHYR